MLCGYGLWSLNSSFWINTHTRKPLVYKQQIIFCKDTLSKYWSLLLNRFVYYLNETNLSKQRLHGHQYTQEAVDSTNQSHCPGSLAGWGGGHWVCGWVEVALVGGYCCCHPPHCNTTWQLINTQQNSSQLPLSSSHYSHAPSAVDKHTHEHTRACTHPHMKHKHIIDTRDRHPHVTHSLTT